MQPARNPLLLLYMQSKSCSHSTSLQQQGNGPTPRVLASLPSGGQSGKDVVHVPRETTRQVALCLASGRPVFYLDEKSGEVH